MAALSVSQDNIRVIVSPAARGMIGHLRQMFHYLLSPAYFLPKVQTTEMPKESASVDEAELSFLCSSVKFYPSRTDTLERLTGLVNAEQLRLKFNKRGACSYTDQFRWFFDYTSCKPYSNSKAMRDVLLTLLMDFMDYSPTRREAGTEL
ncbi:hypothetical protein AAHC03_04834 [Spirometra sp. Aus1]